MSDSACIRLENLLPSVVEGVVPNLNHNPNFDYLKYSLLGDDGTGKTSFVTKLRSPGDDEIKKGSGLEFAFVDVHDEERDGRC